MDLFDMRYLIVISWITNKEISVKKGDKLDLSDGMSRIKCPTLVLGVKSDILFPVWFVQ